jgi:adenylate kinase family enzyme
MDKITIIGSPGAGKSWLAQKLGSIFHIKVYHLDRIFHRRDWENQGDENRYPTRSRSGEEVDH